MLKILGLILTLSAFAQPYYDTGDCLKVVCDARGTCSSSDVLTVANNCRNNYNGDCVRAVLTAYPSGRDNASNFARYCQDVSASCVSYVCSQGRLGFGNCDSIDAIQRVLKSCQNIR